MFPDPQRQVGLRRAFLPEQEQERLVENEEVP